MKHCSNCGHIQYDDGVYCERCGNTLEEVESAPEKNKSHKKLIVALVVGVLVLLLCVIILVVLLARDRGKTPINSDTATSESVIPQISASPSNEEVAGSSSTNVVNSINVESEVTRIRSVYNEIENDCSSGSMSESSLNGASLFANNKGQRKVVASYGDNGIPYTQYYYYDNGDLIFCYFEAEDSYRLYFVDGRLIRLRYCADAKDYNNAVNRDLEDSAIYNEWENKAKQAASRYS